MIETKALTDDEAATVLATAHLLGPQEAALAELAVNSGLRLVEIADLNGKDVRLHETDEQNGPVPQAGATVSIGFGKAPRVIPVVKSVARALAPFSATQPADTPLIPGIATKQQAARRWALLMQEAGVGMDSKVKKANPAASAEAGRNRLLAYLLGLEEKGILPTGYAGGYLGLPGTAYDDLPAGWQDEVVRAIRNGPTGAVGDLSAAGTPTD
ncbi:hypothetical protein ACWEO1_31515 [Kitasatospora cineracea]